jgi:hypothetical protein
LIVISHKKYKNLSPLKDLKSVATEYDLVSEKELPDEKKKKVPSQGYGRHPAGERFSI